MSENKKINLTKKDISKKINLKTGLSNLYTNQITDDFINILKNLIRNKEISIKNFATFKTISKNERIGRNPKTMEDVMISERNVLKFKPSKMIIDHINKLNDTKKNLL